MLLKNQDSCSVRPCRLVATEVTEQRIASFSWSCRPLEASWYSRRF